MTTELFLHSYSAASGLHAVLEDNGTVGVLYLHLQSPTPGKLGAVCADVFAYNRVDFIDPLAVPQFRGGPPPIARGYGDSGAIITDPEHYSWDITWSPDGDRAILLRDGAAWCSVSKTRRGGRSKALVASGPWGDPWGA